MLLFVCRSCETCIENKNCGFCYDDFGNGTTNGSCMSTEPNISYALSGRCSSEYLANNTDTNWADGYCPTPYSWMAILGLALYVMFFAPGKSRSRSWWLNELMCADHVINFSVKNSFNFWMIKRIDVCNSDCAKEGIFRDTPITWVPY